MDEGIYEQLITDGVRAALSDGTLSFQTAPVEDSDQPHILARHIGEAAHRYLSTLRMTTERVNAANRILELIAPIGDSVIDPTSQVLRLYRASEVGSIDRTERRPSTPLSEVALLTNARGEPSIGHEIPAEIASADRVDLICAFIRWSGVRLLDSELRALAEAGKQLRVITTTYLGSTERATLDRLVRDYGAEVCVQYDALRTRLHAKAWLFRRESGFDTAFIGSSNLSNAALIDGVEWNVRLSRVSTPGLIEKFQSTFETYWNDDPTFERYDPDRDRDRLDDALAEASGSRTHSTQTLSISGLEVRPYPYQQTMLEELRSERDVHDRHRNLVVAATGTGKTVLAALDYRRLSEQQSERPSLLFVAHRQEILNQALRTYREVLGDGSFGEVFVGGRRPERWRHVFASVQSLTSYGVVKIPADHFDVVVVDEFHHAEARTYRQIIDHLAPAELLGLTATPERSDGINVREFFDNRIASELRLWEALEAELLCPFHYFGIADNTDLTALRWTRGRYDPTQLSDLYTGNQARAKIILKSIMKQVVSPHDMRALGFCVSIQHAQFMVEAFTEAGIPSRLVHGSTPQTERDQAVADLRDRTINVVFSVDVFNEGLDIPSVDTVLMLRPTESVTIFLQQLGRGLRRTADKPVLTVLDFVGHQRDEFRWDLRLRALTGRPRGQLAPDVEHQFPTLPSGCRIVLDEETQRTVLDSVRRQMRMRWPDIVSELRSQPHSTLTDFLSDTGLPLSSLTSRRDKSWTALRRSAGVLSPDGSDLEANILVRNRAFTHVDDHVRADGYRDLLRREVRFDDLSPTEQRLASMLVFSVWPNGGGHKSIDDSLVALRSEPEAHAELLSIADYALDRSRQRTRRLDLHPSLAPLQLHARYQREEILAALGEASYSALPSNFREGVKHVRSLNVDAFFVTLVKNEKSYSPTTLYRDYPISRTLFHWESQSTTRSTSPTGQRYLTGTSTVVIFARIHRDDEYGTAPYIFLGPATYMNHEGERPISIIWKLEHEMPATMFNEAKLTAG